MKLYIQIQNGQPINHPATEENLLEAYNEIPSDWEPFVRVPRPTNIGFYEVIDGDSSYQKRGQNWMDVWNVRPMTQEEKDVKNLASKTRAENILAKRKETANSQIESETDPDMITALQQYIADLNSYVFQTYDPIAPPLPKSPIQISKTPPV